MTKKLALILISLAVLGGCASIPTEFKSPCACDFKPINEQIEDEGKAVT